ncbi:helix-turn-helix domain-containing protein [Rhodoferax sp. 4810]|uniref:Helix-turn-helix domain-containing protein n=1 Tax=Thiospirillum jenense TaxID=1653858 RepID=A0A839HDQ1_9GAMM|nr:YdaS family helix-turn-helix protein [Thiospirillum jenense]MBB1074500.1 helix-turn-helix domain-containing protein [Rhodoferax jenense]MBB1125516.1 helix-turn-helix domain-containing protein [Thiospirillum jenense]
MEIAQIIDRIGVVELSKRLGCTKQCVSHWRTGRNRIPAEYAVKIEEVSLGIIKRYELRPDLWELNIQKSASNG